MTTTTTYRSTVVNGRNGFTQQLQAEWTKLWSVPRWAAAVGASVVFAVLWSMFMAGGSSQLYEYSTDVVGVVGPAGQPITDNFHFAHQPLTGDGSVVAHVSAQQHSHDLAKAGLMIKESTEPGSPYAAVFATPRHGVRMQANFTTDIAGGTGGVPRWLRLRRSGATITGYESVDGRTWREVGSVELPALRRRVEFGIFVASPNTRTIEFEGGSEGSTIGTATFDHVRLQAQGSEQPVALAGEPIGTPADDGNTSQRAGTFTVTGSGDVGLFDNGFDITQMSLAGVSFMLVLIIVLGVRFITAEYQDGMMIRTTFAASPRRGRVLAAKALVVGVTAFVAALVAGAVAFHLAQPRLYANGFAPAGAPFLSLTGGPVLRAVVGSAALVALWAVLSLCLGTILRRTGVAVAAALALLIIPSMVGTYLPLGIGVWLRRLTPLAGFAIQKTIVRYDDAISPVGGLGVLAAYTSAAFVVALWRLRTRDV